MRRLLASPPTNRPTRVLSWIGYGIGGLYIHFHSWHCIAGVLLEQLLYYFCLLATPYQVVVLLFLSLVTYFFSTNGRVSRAGVSFSQQVHCRYSSCMAFIAFSSCRDRQLQVVLEWEEFFQLFFQEGEGVLETQLALLKARVLEERATKRRSSIRKV